MSYGFFDDTQKEYVIKRPDTPLPWINYLGTENFFGIISNTAGGWLVFGVKKSGTKYDIIGLKNREKIEQDFISTLRNGSKFNKKIVVTSKKYNFNGKFILAFYIPQRSARDKPIYFTSKILQGYALVFSVRSS